MAGMAHRDWEVRWTSAAVLLKVPLVSAPHTALPTVPETLMSEIRAAICTCLKSDQCAVRDVADYVLNRGLRGDDHLCKLALDLMPLRRAGKAGTETGTGRAAGRPATRPCGKRPAQGRLSARRFAKALRLGPSQPVLLE